MMGVILRDAIHFYKFFASYSRKDSEQVIQAAGLLRSTGADLFMDALKLRGGDEWEAKIFEAIRSADKFYLFWSREARNSAWVAKELQAALAHVRSTGVKDFIVPILLDETPVPEEASLYQALPLSLISEGRSLGFSTEKVRETKDGLEFQFSLSNPNKQGQVNVFEIIPVVFYRHHKILYARAAPHRLAPTTIQSLRRIRRRPGLRLLQSGDGVFVGMSIIENQIFRLDAGEIETLVTELVVDPTLETIFVAGFIVQFSGSDGRRRSRTSDTVLVIDGSRGRMRLAIYDEAVLRKHLADMDHFDYMETITATKSYDVAFDFYAGVPCNWEELLLRCREFLMLHPEDLDLMEDL